MKSQYSMKVGFDCDDILVPFVPSFVDYHNVHYGTGYGVEDITDYDISKVFNISEKQVKERIAAFVSTDIFKNMPAFPGAVEGVRTLSQEGNLPYWSATGETSSMISPRLS